MPPGARASLARLAAGAHHDDGGPVLALAAQLEARAFAVQPLDDRLVRPRAARDPRRLGLGRPEPEDGARRGGEPEPEHRRDSQAARPHATRLDALDPARDAG